MNVEERSRFVDPNLIRAVQAGDQEAFEKLYKDYYAYVFRICFAYFRDKHKAEDIIQEVFVKVYQKIQTLTTPESFVVWLNRIAYNCCSSTYRKQKQDASSYVYDEDESYIENIEQTNKKIDALSAMEYKQAKQIIMKSLENMKPNERLVGFLCFFEELRYEEIAEVTGIPRNTVASHIKRIKDKLRKSLEKNHITKECCMSVLLVPNLISIYQDFVSSFPTPKPSTLNMESIITSKSTISLFKNIPQVMTIALSIAIPTSIITYQNLQNNQSNGVNAKIQDIVFNKQLTNQSIPIDIQLTEGGYDQILIDGKETLDVSKNGMYTAELYKDKNRIDSKQFEVKNIDKQAPIVKEVETKEFVELRISDSSGIDYNHLEMYINGELTNDFTFNKTNNTLQISKDIKKKIMVSVKDLAGNKLNVKVQFYKSYK